MKIIWQRDLDKLLVKKLTGRERRQYRKSLKTLSLSWKSMKRESDIQLSFVLKAIGCRCINDVVALRDEALKICKQITNGDVLKYSEKRLSLEYRSALRKLSRKYSRKRKCHLNLRAFVCYCDEHNH